ncbi:MAG: hypothetical protein NVS84_00160 [Candidatus Carsonella ruddii]|nr:MAG: hypothetical protein NVS84_00160 [Candidatus Carsonella ruddii]
MNFIKNNIKKIKEEFNFLNLNLEQECLIKIIYIETMLFLKNKNNIKKMKENLKINFFLLYEHLIYLIKLLFNYENNCFFFVKQSLFFIIIMKYLLFVIIKKVLISIFSFNYSIVIINVKSKINFKNKKTDVLDISSKDKFIFFKYVSYNVLYFILSKIFFLISYFI